jgi:hypothetical protein
MTEGELDDIITQIDSRAQGEGNMRRFTVEGYQVLVISDEDADRVRLMAEVADESALPEGMARRLLQANFDSALDARYAIAGGTLWSVYIHPLGSLTEPDLLSAIAQVVNLVLTFGTTFSSGALLFGGGDSAALNEDVYERLLKKPSKN